MIYFAQTRDNTYIKIGYASNVEKRMAALQTGAPVGVKLLGTMPGTMEIEKDLHKKFAWLRGHGEWFKTHPEIVRFATKSTALGRMTDADPFLRYCIIEPAILDLYVEAAAITDDPANEFFCANNIFFDYSGRCRNSIKRKIMRLVGWHAEDGTHPDLLTEEAYNVVYDRIYDALPDCRHIGACA